LIIINCYNCGKEVELLYEYCPYCGETLKKESAKEKLEVQDIEKEEFIQKNDELQLDNGLDKDYSNTDTANEFKNDKAVKFSEEKTKNNYKFNFWAFLFRGLWYIFHGMIGKGIFILIIGTLLSMIHPILLLGTAIYCGVNAEKDLAEKKVGKVENKKYLKGDSYNLENKLFNFAKRAVNPDAVLKLVEKGVNINIEDEKGKTPLMYAAQYNHNAIMIKYLLKYGAEIDSRDNEGITALMYAARYNKKNVISALLKNKPNLKIKDNNGRTAKDYAVDNKNLNQSFIDENLLSNN